MPQWRCRIVWKPRPNEFLSVSVRVSVRVGVGCCVWAKVKALRRKSSLWPCFPDLENGTST